MRPGPFFLLPSSHIAFPTAKVRILRTSVLPVFPFRILMRGNLLAGLGLGGRHTVSSPRLATGHATQRRGKTNPGLGLFRCAISAPPPTVSMEDRLYTFESPLLFSSSFFTKNIEHARLGLDNARCSPVCLASMTGQGIAAQQSRPRVDEERSIVAKTRQSLFPDGLGAVLQRF